MFDYFDKIYCINLPDSEDRKELATEEFRKVGIDDRVEFIYATPPHESTKCTPLKFPKGEIGVSLSQIKAVVHAIDANANNVLIFEDDFTFIDSELKRIKSCIQELPEDWDVFFLGGHPIAQMMPFSMNLLKTRMFVQANAYAINSHKFVELYDMVMDNLTIHPYDWCTGKMAAHGKGYTASPPICVQRAGDSIIRGGYRSYTKKVPQHWREYTP